MQYKKYYDFSIELYNQAQKAETNPSMIYQKPISKESPVYNNYFEPKQKEKKQKER